MHRVVFLEYVVDEAVPTAPLVLQLFTYINDHVTKIKCYVQKIKMGTYIYLYVPDRPGRVLIPSRKGANMLGGLETCNVVILQSIMVTRC